MKLEIFNKKKEQLEIKKKMHSNYSSLQSDDQSIPTNSFSNQNVDPTKLNSHRRFSLQTPSETGNAEFSQYGATGGNMAKYSLGMQQSPLSTNMYSTNQDMFMDQTNFHDLRKVVSNNNFQQNTTQMSSTFDPNSTYSKFLLHQQQQQQQLQFQQKKKQHQLQQQAQTQENFSNFVRLCNYSGIDLNADLTIAKSNNDNVFFGSSFGTG